MLRALWGTAESEQFGATRQPRMLERAAVSLRLRAADLADTVIGRRDGLTPPRRLARQVGDSDFRETGEQFLELFQTLGNLQPSDQVLDIGCGIGRMARTLVTTLRPPGSYDGFDIDATAIDWCRAHYLDTPVPFRFAHADLRNEVYNPEARGNASTYTFPYPDQAFDFALATSVFTHLLPDAAARYLAESARVLKPGGRLFSTWFLLDDETEPPPPFTRDGPWRPAAVARPDAPEAAVAYPESWLRERLREQGLAIDAITRGSWQSAAGTTLQDTIVAHRPS
jgi:SAM-dependent methyltransferase